MSTILDALRKSEQERKLNRLPTLTDMTAPQEPSRWPIYIGLALVLLAITLVVLAYIIWSAKAEVAQAPDSAAATSQSKDSEVVGVEGVSSGIQGTNNARDSMLVNVVSYSTDPALRFAMVNGKLVREGEFIEPGLKVEEILSDSVVFNVRGKKVTRSP